MQHKRMWGGWAAAGMVALLCACSASAPRPSASTSTPAQPTPSVSSTPTTAPAPPTPVRPVGDPVVIAEGLDAPWSVLRLPSGATLISERDSALVRELLPDGSLRDAGSVADVVPNGEGGLLGLAYLPAAAEGTFQTGTALPADPTAAAAEAGWVYAYFTAASENRIVRMPLTGSAGSLGLGAAEPVLSGIPAAGNHNGGRIAFGPDGLLYATAGDAGSSANAQDLGSLGGKILRMTPTGDVPADNPFGTLVYSYGHRNPQGIAWDSTGRLWASEFGQNTWDELNQITAGGNYGWPEVEGRAGGNQFRDPARQWRTDAASPSGIAVAGGSVFMAGLRGERLWQIPLLASGVGKPRALLAGRYGRLPAVAAAPDGSRWVLTNNTDGRGSPRQDDDRIIRLELSTS
ncbi:MAG: PQQ-dependent sugar dehydrogenase [Cryobacterium sp.]